MTLLTLVAWMVRELARKPATWLALALGALSWPLLALFTPVVLTSSATLPQGLLYELAFVGAQLGALAAFLRVAELGWILSRAPRGLRSAVSLTLLTIGGATGAAAGLAVPVLAGILPLEHLGPMLLRVLAMSAHLAALGLWLLLLPSPSPLRALGLPVLAWAVPALVGGTHGLSGWWTRLLAVSPELAPASAGAAAELGARAGPIVALALGALLAERGLSGPRARPGR